MREPKLLAISDKHLAVAKYALVWIISIFHTSWYAMYLHSTYTKPKQVEWGLGLSFSFFLIQIPATFISGALYETFRKKFHQPQSINVISQCLLVSQFICIVCTLLVFLELIHL